MFDCIIIGAGVSGATIARELSKYELKVLILEKEADVALGSTLANSAIVHSGHDPLPGSLKSKINVLGNRMYKKMSEELDIPYLDCGGMVIAKTEEEVVQLTELFNRAIKNGLNELPEIESVEVNVETGEVTIIANDIAQHDIELKLKELGYQAQ